MDSDSPTDVRSSDVNPPGEPMVIESLAETDLNSPTNVGSSDVNPPGQPTATEDDARLGILNIDPALLNPTFTLTMPNGYTTAQNGDDSHQDLPPLNATPVFLQPYEVREAFAERLATSAWKAALDRHCLTQLGDPCIRYYLGVNICMSALDDQRTRDQYARLWNSGRRPHLFEFALRLTLSQQLKDKIISSAALERPPPISPWAEYVDIYRRKLEILSNQWAEDDGEQFDEKTLTEYTRNQWELMQAATSFF